MLEMPVCQHCNEETNEGLTCDECGIVVCGECMKTCDCGREFCPEHVAPDTHACEGEE